MENISEQTINDLKAEIEFLRNTCRLSEKTQLSNKLGKQDIFLSSDSYTVRTGCCNESLSRYLGFMVIDVMVCCPSTGAKWYWRVHGQFADYHFLADSGLPLHLAREKY